ncbi:MAG: DegT/DnrJ/EryC1/StrS aminotransferase family protein [Acidobacteriaceae bacterium]|nr:DegT/DnrJ/EryC1/StrS aminotransferase family protein [Acidobacteriaceae bacterium]
MTTRESPEAPALRESRLAIDGGHPVRTLPFAHWPSYSREEIDAVVRVLGSGKVNYWTGQEGRQFEAEFAAFTGCKHAVAVANGTVALELALEVLGIGRGDEVIVPSRTFIASASCAVMRGAIPVVADVDRDSQTITPQTILPVLTSRTRAIIAVHLAGWPCDMDCINSLARKYGLKVIEDCAQAHGASYKGRRVGSMGDANGFSFCQDKIITTGGEGGMLTTNDVDLWSRAWAFKDHGKSHDAVYNRHHPPGYRWMHESFGTNWRLTEMQSAIGRLQLAKLEESVATRRSLTAVLTRRFSQVPALRVTVPPADVCHSYYKYYVFLRRDRLRRDWAQQRIIAALNAEGVPCIVGSCSEIYLERAFPESMRPHWRFPVAQELGETSLMFPVHPTLNESDMHDIADAVEKVLSQAARR